MKQVFLTEYDYDTLLNAAQSILFLNPNPGQGVKSTETLNYYASRLEKSEWVKKYVSEWGFELNPIYFTWELHIKFNGRSGFMVFNENDKPKTLNGFVYSHEDDLDWQTIILVDCQKTTKHYLKFEQTIKTFYHAFIRDCR